MLKYYPEDGCNGWPRVTAWLFFNPKWKQNRVRVWATEVKYLICVSGGHFFPWLQWAPVCVCDRKIMARWTVIVCVHFYMCMCEKERHGCVQTHTLPRSHRSSQGQSVTPTCSTTFASIFSLLSSSSLMQREGDKVMPLLTFLYTVMIPQHPVLLGGKGRGEHRAGLDEQTVGTALPAMGMRELPWA